MRRRRAWVIPTIGRWSTSGPKPTASGSPTSTTSGTSRSTPRPRSHSWPSSRRAAGRWSSASARAASRSRSPRTASRSTASTPRPRWSSRCAPSREVTRSRSRSATWPTSPVDGEFALVFVVFNTFFQLYSQESQLRCFANVARHLQPGGRFLIHVFVPDTTRVEAGEHLAVKEASLDRVRLDASVFDARSNGSTPRRCASPRTGSGSCTPSCGSRGRPSSTSWPARGTHARTSLGDVRQAAVQRREPLPRFRLSRMI